MPCDSSGYPSSGTDYEAQKEIKWLKKELDSVTRMLCFVLHAMQHGARGLPPDIAEWYAKHQAWDKSQGR